jgi:hypothetical protein
MVSGHPEAAELERIRQLARDLADRDPGPAAELACALADAVAGLAGRVDGLWRLITAVVESAGLVEAAGPAGPGASAPPAEFLQAVSSPRGTSDRALRLNINNKEWVAAISQDQPPADPARTWAALERLTKDIDDQAGA